jgi:Cdc6-like AAA superfamily ATPase
VIPLCSAIAVKRGGDARVALALLHSAGKAAERENAAKVEVRHVRATEAQALQASEVKAERKLGDLDGIDQAIVDAVKASGKQGIESGSLYSALEKTAGERAIRQRVDRLEKNGIFSIETVQSGKGRSRVIRLRS